MRHIHEKLLKIGLSKPPMFVPFFTDEPKFYNFFCLPSEEAKEKYFTEDVFGQGYDKKELLAKAKSVGEMLERLCLCNPPKNLESSKYEAGKEFQDPSSFFCYSRKQMPNRDLIVEDLRKGSYRWIRSRNLTTGRNIYVPAQIIFLSSVFGDEFALRKEQISTGAALGANGEERALKSGFLEVIERDGIMAFYLKKLEGRKMYGFPKRINDLVGYLKRYNLETHIFDVTTDLGIPTIFALTLDRTGIGDAVNVGSKASLSYSCAIIGSIMESIQCRRLGRSANPFEDKRNVPKAEEINSLEARLIYWAQRDRIGDIAYLFEEEPSIDYESLKRKTIRFDQAIDNVRLRGYQIIVTDITLPELKGRHFEVLKVTIPELHPLYLDERAKALYSKHHGGIREDPLLKPHPVT